MSRLMNGMADLSELLRYGFHFTSAAVTSVASILESRGQNTSASFFRHRTPFFSSHSLINPVTRVSQSLLLPFSPIL